MEQHLLYLCVEFDEIHKLEVITRYKIANWQYHIRPSLVLMQGDLLEIRWNIV